MKIGLFVLACFSLFSCNYKAKETFIESGIEVIHVKNTFDQKDKVLSSKIASKIEYIPLETNVNCQVGRNTRLAINDEYLIVVSFRQIFLFDRATGDFVREIGGFGNGPEEYNVTTFQPYNPDRQVIRALSNRNTIIEYNIDGSIIRNIKSPFDYIGMIHTEMDEGTYASYMPNVTGDTKELLFLFDENGNEVMVIPNENFYVREDPKHFSMHGREAEFYRFNSDTYFKEIWNDTLFAIKRQSLIPQYTFDSKDVALRYDLKEKKDADEMMKARFKITNLFETTHLLFFTVNFDQKIFAGIYDKRNSTTEVSNYNDELKENGIFDDKLNAPSFIPLGVSATEEVFGLIKPESADLQELNKILRKQNKREVKLESNPVVAICSVK